MTEQQRLITGQHVVDAIEAGAFPREVLDELSASSSDREDPLFQATVNARLHDAAVKVSRGNPILRGPDNRPIKTVMGVIELVRPLVQAALETMNEARNSESI